MGNELTPLHAAVSGGLLDIVHVLCKSGIDINQRNREGVSPLMQGVINGMLAAVDYLAEQGADINLPNHRGLSPLAVAVQNENVEVVRYLLQLGADTNILDDQGNTALFHATKGGQSLICQMLINEGTNVNIHNKAKEYPITIAAMRGIPTIAQLLIDLGCDINVVSNEGTPVYFAAKCQHVNVFKLLLKEGADVGKLGPNKRLPLVAALHHRTPNYDVIMELLRAGTNIGKAVCDCHTSPIDMVMATSNIRVIGLLLQADAQVGDVNYEMEEIEEFGDKFHVAFTRLMGDNVTSLKGLCRNAIKDSTGAVNYKAKVESLPLPGQLQKYLLHFDVMTTEEFLDEHYQEFMAEQ